MEDTTTVYYCIKNGKFLWDTEKFEDADFSVIELQNVGKLLDLIKEKGLSKDDLTLILKTICLRGHSNKVNVAVEVAGINENTKKTQKLIELLKEAKSLADDLASIDLDIKTNI